MALTSALGDRLTPPAGHAVALQSAVPVTGTTTGVFPEDTVGASVKLLGGADVDGPEDPPESVATEGHLSGIFGSEV